MDNDDSLIIEEIWKWTSISDRFGQHTKQRLTMQARTQAILLLTASLTRYGKNEFNPLTPKEWGELVEEMRNSERGPEDFLRNKPEELHASKLLNQVEVITLLDYGTGLNLLKKPIPSEVKEILDWLQDEKMIEDVDGKGYYITNFGAIAAAKDLKKFDGLSRKTIRLIKYEGKTKRSGSKEYPGLRGYAIGFDNLIQFVKGVLPGSEVIKNALRTETPVYPEIAIRELIANVLIHQDFNIRGTGPMIEIFEDRIEFTNPGKLLPSKRIDRLIRTTPESRNEILASAFRRYNICEERGSGFEKAVSAIEFYGLPPLKFSETENSFKVTMYCPKTFGEMTSAERKEACYQHSIIQYYGNGGFNNSSLRKRFGMHDKQAAQVSKLIKECIEVGRIKPKDPDSVSKKFSLYVPYWA